MKTINIKKLILSLALLSCTIFANSQSQNLRRLNGIDFSNVKIHDTFWSPRLSKHLTATLPVCIDQIENQTGRIQNFVNSANRQGKHSGIFFDDSDVYKALEGISYALANNRDSKLEAKADEWIGKIAAAQQPDGYINTYYTLSEPQNRWTNMDKHEMYCAGHLIEAGVAYYKATGKRSLLDVGQRMADYMMTVFGPFKGHWVAGHEEIELALVKLYGVTGDKKYLDFANWLLEQRGHGYGSTGIAQGRDGAWNPVYYQDDMPLRELSEIKGHAVRAMYLYCGMADVAALKGDTGYINAMNRVWDNVVYRKMYITGGIGSSAENEGFSGDFDLPNKEAYCETCASVGMVYWNQRMNELTGDAKYIDVLERSMYNGALAGVSLAGDKFFYVNPLESDGDHHRQAWYGCACCPSQISRFLPSIGNYIYGVSQDAIWVNLFIGNETKIDVNGQVLTLKLITNYPWNGEVKLTVESTKPIGKYLRVRVPGWCHSYIAKINGKEIRKSLEKGYLMIDTRSNNKLSFALSMQMPVEMVASDPRVKQDVGKRAIQSGPLVYCMEETDNEHTFSQPLSDNSKFSVKFDKKLLGGVNYITAKSAYGGQLKFIPYYAWDNRKAGKMQVWINLKQ